MKTNVLPAYDASDNPTGCCPRFNPQGWDKQNLHFRDKLFVRATTQSDNHIPIDMAEVFDKTFSAIQQGGVLDYDNMIVMSRELSAELAEHYFSVSGPVPGLKSVRLSGDYLTRVFDCDYAELPAQQSAFIDEIESAGKKVKKVYDFYTTCPRCAEAYGHNYIVEVIQYTSQ